MADIFDMDNPVSELHGIMLATRALIYMMKGETSDITRQARLTNMTTNIENMIRTHVRKHAAVRVEYYGAGQMGARGINTADGIIKRMAAKVHSRIIGKKSFAEGTTQFMHSPARATRVQYILAWGSGHFKHIQVLGKDQLVQEMLPTVDTWTPNFSREFFLKLVENQPDYFDIEIEEPMFQSLRVSTIGIDLPTIPIGGNIAFEWEGRVDTLVLIASALSDGH